MSRGLDQRPPESSFHINLCVSLCLPLQLSWGNTAHLNDRACGNASKGKRITSIAPAAFAEENLGCAHGHLHEGTHLREGPPTHELHGGWVGRGAQGLQRVGSHWDRCCCNAWDGKGVPLGHKNQAATVCPPGATGVVGPGSTGEAQ